MRQEPDRWALIREEGPVVAGEVMHTHTLYTHIYTSSSPSLSHCGKHTHQSGGCPRRGRACLTSLIGFFGARSQGDEKLYQAEIINFALTTLNSLTLHISQKMKKGENYFSLLTSCFFFFFLFNPSISIFCAQARGDINGVNVCFC